MLPENGFKVYKYPGGVLSGSLKINPYKKKQDDPFVVIIKNNSIISEIDLNNFYQVGYEEYAIKYFNKKGNFVQIINEDSELWLDVRNIEQEKFETITWRDFLIKNSGKVLGYYANDPGLNLREAATTNSKVIKTLEGDLFQITPTKETKGNWVKVLVKKFKEHPCVNGFDEDLIQYELEGWVKIVDDKGLPNVWFYSRGC
ncbi:MAG: SH3 domain-containing protein [Candidatus Cyclobacteriaceae bacterium M2_1C_046]